MQGQLDVAPLGTGHVGCRRPIRHRARDLHRRHERAAHSAAARRRRRVLARRQLVHAHRPAACLRAERPRRERDADRPATICSRPSSLTDKAQPAAQRRGERDCLRHRRHQSAQRRCAQFCLVQEGRGPAAGARRQVLLQRQVRRRGNAREGAVDHQGTAVPQGAGHDGVELGRLLSRRQYRLQRRRRPHRRGIRRRDHRGRSPGVQVLLRDRRFDRRRPAWLQLAGGPLGRRHRSGLPGLTPAGADSTIRLRRRELQSGHRRIRDRRAGLGVRRSKVGLVRNAARASRGDPDAGNPGVSHRRSGGRQDQDLRHGQRFQPRGRRRGRPRRKPGVGRRRQPGLDRQHQRHQRQLRRPQDQGGLDVGRRRRGPPRRQLDRQGRVPLHGFRQGLERRQPFRRTRRRSRSPSIPASPTTSSGSA